MEDIGLALLVQPVHEVGIEDLPGEVERVTLKVEERDEQVDHLAGRKLLELALQHLLHKLPELEAVRRMEVQLAKDSAILSFLSYVRKKIQSKFGQKTIVGCAELEGCFSNSRTK